MNIFIGLMIPFLGTTLGSAMVFFMRKEMKAGVQKFLSGFAAGVMVAASVWSLLIPAMEMSEPMGKLAFVPAAVGFLAGIGFLLVPLFLRCVKWIFKSCGKMFTSSTRLICEKRRA